MSEIRFTGIKVDPSSEQTSTRQSCAAGQEHGLQLSSNQGVLVNDTDSTFIVMLVRGDNGIQEMWAQPPRTSVGCTAGYGLCIKAGDNLDDIFWATGSDTGDYSYRYNWSSSVRDGGTFYFSKMSY